MGLAATGVGRERDGAAPESGSSEGECDIATDPRVFRTVAMLGPVLSENGGRGIRNALNAPMRQAAVLSSSRYDTAPTWTGTG